MLPVGNLLRIIHPKVLVLVGIILAEAAVFTMTQFTTDGGATAVLLPLILRGIAMAFLFVPINQMVLGSFSGQELGQVAGMQNFFRQIGGSIGISSLDTLITRFSAQHYNDMMGSVNALNPAAYQSYTQAARMAGGKLSSSIGLWNPASLAVKSLHNRVLLQVFIMSFEQLCWVIMVIVACGLIPLYLIKYTPKKGAAPIMDSH
jgi:DHA2 family multidrug resistance protein